MGIVCCRLTVGNAVEHLTPSHGVDVRDPLPPRQWVGESAQMRMKYWHPTGRLAWLIDRRCYLESTFSLGVKCRARELMQYRLPVLVGPSSKTCPR